jgi:hypothetical protein
MVSLTREMRVSVSQRGDVLAITSGNRPVIEPDAHCDGCGTRGTVGRASRGSGASAPAEEHRFCAGCWPEWSAFYRARWHEQARQASLAWHARPPAARDTPPPTSGTWFESATWHGVIDFVHRLTVQARYDRDPPSRESLARFAADIRAHAAEKVGPMPIEVRAFLAEFGRDDPGAPAS